MKTKIISTATALLISFFSLYSQTQKKDIVWMHGLNGERSDMDDLSYYARVFRYEFSGIDRSFAPLSKVPTKYSGVKAIADFLSREMSKRSDVGDHKTLFVGHSLGGIVGKELDIRKNEQKPNALDMDGIITLGAPLSGAKIANSLQSPFFPYWVAGYGSPVNNFIRESIRVITTNLPLSLTLLGVAIVAAYLKATNRLEKFFKPIDPILKDMVPISGTTWHDLKTTGYSRQTRYKSTATPKINLWANIERPVVQTIANNNGFGQAYRDVLYWSNTAYHYARWIPGISIATRGFAKIYAYYNFTIHGRYTNLIADGVTYDWRKINLRTNEIKRSCWTESRRRTARACRGWGWFRWLCWPFVQLYHVVVCTVRTYFIDHEVWFQLPHYPDTDGVVSKASAIGEGSRWRGVDVEVPRTDHSELAKPGSRGEYVLRDIFWGRHPKIQSNEGLKKIFKLEK